MNAAFSSSPVLHFFYPGLQCLALASPVPCNRYLLIPLAWFQAVLGHQVTPGVTEIFVVELG